MVQGSEIKGLFTDKLNDNSISFFMSISVLQTRWRVADLAADERGGPYLEKVLSKMSM